jgi:hypothetical protein
MLPIALAHPPTVPGSARRRIGPRFVSMIQGIIGVCAVVFSLAHCVAVVVTWSGSAHGWRFLGTRLLLGLMVLAPGAVMLSSLRELVPRPGLRSLGATVALAAVSAAQTLRYQATFPLLFAMAAAVHFGWLLAYRGGARRDASPWWAVAWVLFPLLALAALVAVLVAFDVSDPSG